MAHGSSSHVVCFRNRFDTQTYIEPQITDATNLVGPTFAGAWLTNQGGFNAVQLAWCHYSNSYVGNVFATNILRFTNGVASAIFTNGPGGGLPNQNVPMILTAGYLNTAFSASEIPEDPLVMQTVWWHGNWDPVNNTTIWNPADSNHALPASLIYSAQPGWWPAAVPWPPIGPDLTPMTAPIPAEVRFYSYTNKFAAWPFFIMHD
jgi:hypothetical protein